MVVALRGSPFCKAGERHFSFMKKNIYIFLAAKADIEGTSDHNFNSVFSENYMSLKAG